MSAFFGGRLNAAAKCVVHASMILLLSSCTYAQLLTARPVIARDVQTGTYALNGIITFDTASELARQVPAGATLKVTSSGGRSEVAHDIVVWAAANDIHLIITGACSSACANTLTAARNVRFEAPVALLFHGTGQNAEFYGSRGLNPEFIRFADKAATQRHTERAKIDGRKKLYGVAVPYFWVPTAEELTCFGLSAPVKPYSHFKPEAKASGMYFTTEQLPPMFQNELLDICTRWRSRSH